MNRLGISALLLFYSIIGYSQIVKIEPAVVTADDQVKIIYDATQGTGDLNGATKVYMHSGVITSSPTGEDWVSVVGNWGQDDGIGEMTQVAGETDMWEITLTPDIRSYYGIPTGQNVFRLAMVFRDAAGDNKGAGTPGNFTGGFVGSNGDVYVDLDVGEFVSINSPGREVFIKSGSSFSISASSSSLATTLSLSIDLQDGGGFSLLSTISNDQQISFDYNSQQSDTVLIKAEANINGELVSETKETIIFIRGETLIEAIPAGTKSGINYPADDTKAILSITAPSKEFIYVVGDFNNWTIDDSYLMKKSTSDNNIFWYELSGLTPGQEYVFQYWVEGTIKIGDPYADKVADPSNDQFIPASVFPDLIAYTNTNYGIATTLQTGQTPYSWAASEDTWSRPNKEDIIVYELLVRDFVGSHDYKDLTDTLSYMKRLGINTIHMMPLMEFEGNSSWGYNPSYHMAVDKYYGTKNDLKKFIETAHQQGIAVILDMVLNHAFGQNAMVRMYWDEVNNKPSVDNPWFNPDAKHPFNVGFDFNHESQLTKNYVDDVNAYWINEFHFDGFRFDLSKGFTQTNNPDDVGAWGQFDQSRIDILTRMANKIWEVDSSAYVILEHFSEASEEVVLQNSGMITWASFNGTYRDVLAGKNINSFSGIDNLGGLSYMESHDEERVMWEIITNGASNGDYNIKDLETGLNRTKLGAAFFFTVPGPKMMWQFEELGYDVELNDDRLGEKPPPWGGEGVVGNYYTDESRMKVYKTYAAIIDLTHQFENVFKEGAYSNTLTGELRKIIIVHDDMSVQIMGNFGTEKGEIIPNFPQTGLWFDYFSTDTLDVVGENDRILLEPGQFHILTTKKPDDLEANLVPFRLSSLVLSAKEVENLTIDIYPNPANNKITIDGKNQSIVSAVMTDLSGVVIFEKPTDTAAKTSFDVSKYANGIYLLKVTGSNDTLVKKIIVQH